MAVEVKIDRQEGLRNIHLREESFAVLICRAGLWQDAALLGLFRYYGDHHHDTERHQ